MVRRSRRSRRFGSSKILQNIILPGPGPGSGSGPCNDELNKLIDELEAKLKKSEQNGPLTYPNCRRM